ncbi:MAG: peptidase S53, partial [Sulfolobus sp.]|nr:peptidase S53 [Sulfolobus sp.]
MKGLKGLMLIVLLILPIMFFTNQTVAKTDYHAISPIVLKGYNVIGSVLNSTIVYGVIFIPLRNLQELESLAFQVNNPNSPLYSHFLTKRQVEELFYPTNQYNEVMNYLKRFNLSIILSALDSVIVIEGTVQQFENAFGVNYYLYSNGTYSYYTASGNLTLPNVYFYSSNVTSIFFSYPSFLLTKENVENFLRSANVSNLTEPIEAINLPQLQNVYNLTYLYSKGFMGNGTTIGIIDFYGDPYISQQIAYFDKLYHLPQVSVEQVQVTPTNPIDGIFSGWALEESLDVEAVHAMAPLANIIVYTANPSINLAPIIAYIDQEDEVNVVSMSFGISEHELMGDVGLLPYIINTEYYFMLGTLEGITFVASSGDGGGEGYSAEQPLGAVSWPSVSPFVTAVGGTTVYISGNSSIQTAWSSYGFVPYFSNIGGSTGGISIIFPKPWYQEGIQIPKSFPNGRMVPDVSMSASVYPGVNVIIPGNITVITGGTSESAPLFAGSIDIIDQYLGHRVGLINSLLYELSNNSRIFIPTPFGYNIPWTVHQGYNLVTGLGSINIGELALAIKNMVTKPSLLINVTLNPFLSFYVNRSFLVLANISLGKERVTSGNFSVTLYSLYGLEKIPMKFNGTYWVANVTNFNSVRGLTYVIVNGSYKGIYGIGIIETFIGYILSAVTIAYAPGQHNGTVYGMVCTLNGTVAPNVSVKATIYYFNPLSTSYIKEVEVNLVKKVVIERFLFSGFIQTIEWTGSFNGTLQTTGTLLIAETNASGIIPTIVGANVQGTYVLPPILAMPGVAYPGETLLIEPYILAISYPTTFNFSISLMARNGSILSSTSMTPSYIVIGPYIFLTIEAYLQIPYDISPGYYTIYINETAYINKSLTLGYIGEEIYIAPRPLNLHVNITKYVFEGQRLLFLANISYPNGSEVRYGIFTAIAYPNQLSYEYSDLALGYPYVLQAPLEYNSSINEWEGELIMPSSINLGNLTFLSAGTYQGLFDLFITGISYNGYPLPTTPNIQQKFILLPYLLIQGETLDILQPYDVALLNDVIHYSGNLDNVIFINNNTVEGDIRVVNANISGILIVKDSNITLINVNGGTIYAINSTITLVSSQIAKLILVNTKISMFSSTVSSIYPTLPVIKILTPSMSNLTGIANVTFTVLGEDVSHVIVYLNGIPIFMRTGNGTASFMLNTSKYPDGEYNLTIVAYQNDGLYSSLSTVYNFYNQFVELNQKISNVSSNLTSVSSSLNRSIVSQSLVLSSRISMNQLLSIVSLIIGILALSLTLV